MMRLHRPVNIRKPLLTVPCACVQLPPLLPAAHLVRSNFLIVY